MTKNKMIAPIIITFIIIAYYIIFAYICFIVDALPLFVKILGGIIPIIVAGFAIPALIERIKEIKKGEEDDLSQY